MEPNYSLRGWAEPKQCYDGSDLNIPFFADFGIAADNDEEAIDAPRIPKTPKNLRGGGRMRCWSMPDLPPAPPQGRRGRPGKAEADEKFLREYATLDALLKNLATGQVLCLSGKSEAAIVRHVAAARRIALWHGLTLEWEDKARPERITLRREVNTHYLAGGAELREEYRCIEYRTYAMVVAKRVQSKSEHTTEVS